MAMNPEGYPVFKGLQKPLEFMGIRVRFLTLAAVAIGVSFVGFIGFSIVLGKLAGFIAMLGVTMIAAPGVPGGAIMAALGPLQSMLGFDETLQGLMIALYIAMDSFGTACNLTGDGAIALIIDKVMEKGTGK